MMTMMKAAIASATRRCCCCCWECLPTAAAPPAAAPPCWHSSSTTRTATARRSYTDGLGLERVGRPPRSNKFMLVINNEDWRVETAVLNRLAEQQQQRRQKLQNYSNGDASININMMTVVGGGDTTLVSLMHPAVRSVTGVDMSPNQIHLLYLKLASAVCDLPTAQVLDFLVNGDDGKKTNDDNNNNNSRDVLRKHLVKFLPDESAEFFLSDEMIEGDIDHGILRAENDNPFNTTIRSFLTENHGIELKTFGSNMTADSKQHLYDVLKDPTSHREVSATLKAGFRKAPWFDDMPSEIQSYFLGRAKGMQHPNEGLHLMDLNVPFYRNPDSVATATF